jgi:AhpD family alkylhydroperoxidase
MSAVDEGTRLTPVAVEDFDPALRQLLGADQLSPREIGPWRVYAHRPAHAIAIAHFGGAVFGDHLLPSRLHELVRLRIAFFNQCRTCMSVRYAGGVADGVTEDLVCSLERPQEAADLTDAERSALRFAELMATDHLAITSEVYDDLRRHFTEPEIVELGTVAAFSVGFGRLAATWNVIEDLPERFRQDGVITPWGGDAITV